MNILLFIVLLNILVVIGICGIMQCLYCKGLTLKERAIIFTYNSFIIPFRVSINMYRPLKDDFSDAVKDLSNVSSTILLTFLTIIVIMIAYKLCSLNNEQTLIEKILIVIGTYCYFNCFIDFLYVVRNAPEYIFEILLTCTIVLAFIYCLIRFVLFKIKIKFWHLIVIAFIFILIMA